MEVLPHSIRGLDEFLIYFAASLVLLGVFIAIYIWITPYREIALIREGNAAAAASLSGTVLGFSIPLAQSIAQSVNLAEMAMWGAIALAVQILVFVVASRVVFPGMATDIPNGKVAPGVVVGALSIATGILNAACMTY
jgi:putative membrane protein